MNVPLTGAHITASQMSTSGSAGLLGGCLPVAAFQPPSIAFFATAALPRVATSERIVHAFEPDAICSSCGSMAPTLVARGLLQCSHQRLGAPRGDQPVRRGVAVVLDPHPHRRSEDRRVGTEGVSTVRSRWWPCN